MSFVPDIAKEAVLQESTTMPEGTPIVEGYDWNTGIDYHKLFKSFKHSGFQATNFGNAVDEINKMVRINRIKKYANMKSTNTVQKCELISFFLVRIP